MPAVTLTPAGPFSLASGIRFLEGFSPSSYHHAADGILRLAFPADDGASVVAATVRQEVRADGGTGTVRAEFTVHPGTPHPAKAVTAEAAAKQAVRAQLARVLSLDVDATGFPGLATDPWWPGSRRTTRGCSRCASTPPTKPPPGQLSATASACPRQPPSRPTSPTSTDTASTSKHVRASTEVWAASGVRPVRSTLPGRGGSGDGRAGASGASGR